MTPDMGAQPGELSPSDGSGPRELRRYRPAQGRRVVAAMICGWLLEAGSWRWIFLINVPVAAVVAWTTQRHAPESRDTSLSGSANRPSALATITYAIIVLPGVGVMSPGFAAAAVLAATFFTGPRRSTPAQRPALIQTPVPHLACPVAFRHPLSSKAST